MRCPECQDQLSAFYDHQLSDDMRESVGHHIAECSRCAAELASFESLSEMARASESPRPPAGLWEEIDRAMRADPVVSSSISQARKSRRLTRLMLIAATILLLVGAGTIAYRGWFARQPTDPQVADMARYLELFERDPDRALQMLVTKYDGQLIDVGEPASAPGRASPTAAALARDYKVKQAYVLKMPCCNCVQCLCHSADGRALAVFEHDEAQPMAFGNRPSREARCGGRRCLIVRFGSGLAVSWQQDGRHLTVVGARDLDEIEQLMATLDKPSGNKS